MPQDVRLWEIQGGDRLREIKHTKPNLEERIENWLEQDISIVSDDLLVIGRQVQTGFGGVVDLLCIDSNGDLVIIELKREKTPREVTAQVLDYASWAKDLSNDRITELAERYLDDEDSLEGAFRREFGSELPETLNEKHEMLVVASEIDGSSERIINYLSDTYGVAINALTLQYFRDEEGKEYLARVFLIEPSEVEYKAQTKTASKRKPPLSYDELEAIAERKGVGELYRHLVNQLMTCFDQCTTTRSTVAFIALIEGSRNTIFSLVPGGSDPDRGVHFMFYIERLLRYLDVVKDDVLEFLPSDSWEGTAWKDGPPMIFGYFKDDDEVDSFLAGLTKLKQRDREVTLS